MRNFARRRPTAWATPFCSFAIIAIAVRIGILAVPSGLADSLPTAGITSVGTNAYPNPAKPAPGSQINWNRPLAAGLVSAIPLNEGSGASFYDAVTQQSYSARSLTDSPVGALPPTWFTPTLSADYPWVGPALSNNGATAQAIQSSFQELDLIHDVTTGYSYAVLVQPLDTSTFGRIMDATGAAVITSYLNTSGYPGKVATTWRNAAGTAIVPRVAFTVNQWMLVLCTVQQGLGVMYVNGVPMASDSNVNLAKSWANQTGLLVYNSTGNGGMMCNANFSSWWIWNNRVLTAAEAAQMYANPWTMFHSGAQKGFIKGTEAILNDAAAVSNVCFYSHAAAGNLRLGLYDNGSPKHLLWQSAAVANTAAGAWLTVPVATGSPGTLILPPGTYWLTWQTDTTGDVPSYAAGSSGDGFAVKQDFGNFPAALTGEQSSAETWSLYFNYAPPPAPFLAGLAFQPGGIPQLQVTGSPSLTYGLMASTNLTDWLRLNVTGSVSNGGWVFRDTNAANYPWRFYRVVWP